MADTLSIRNKKNSIKKSNPRKFVTFAFLLVLIIILININITNSKCKDIKYATNHYMTSGFFNKNKVLSINGMKPVFSDDNKAIVEIDGLYYKSPHPRKRYQVSLIKTKGGMWKLDNIKEISS